MTCFLIVGDTEDLTLAWTARAARLAGAEVIQLDEATMGQDWSVEETAAGPTLRRAGEADRPLSSLGPAMIRFHPEPQTHDLPLQDQFDKHLFTRERRAAIHHFLDRLPFAVCNAPGAGMSNNSKPLQMGMLARTGFQIPPWIVTNTRGDADRFLAEHGPCIVKAISGMRSQVREYGPHHQTLMDTGTAPILIQKRVAGLNVRVHVFGDHIAATQVDADGALDYRFENTDQQWTAIDLPEPVADLCRAHIKVEDQILGGLDFLVDGDIWWCLECNPAPTYISYEIAAGQPIAANLVQHLLHAA